MMTEIEILEQYRQRYPALSDEFLDDFRNSAAVCRSISNKRSVSAAEFTDQEIRRPVLPFFLDLEITTACQLNCTYCARTFMKVPAEHMTLQMVRKILDASPNVVSVNLVGLGEPLLHPKLDRILADLQERKIQVSLVTNGMGLDAEKAEMLIKRGLCSLTFSLDTIDSSVLQRYRIGARLPIILENIRQFMALKKSRAPEMTVSIFSVLQTDTIPGLGALAEFARSVSIPAIVISDLNFKENDKISMSANLDITGVLKKLYEQMQKVASLGVVLLTPHILDGVSMGDDWPASIIKKPAQILKKENPKRQYCLAPLRTLVVRVDGGVNYCNCTPDTSAGEFITMTLEEIWWGKGYQNFRNSLISGPLPDCCKVCPRL